MIYLYYCGSCDLEIEQEFALGTQPEEVPCPECGEGAVRKFTAPTAIYKGTGWSGPDHGVPDRDERAKLPGPLEFDDLLED